MKISIIVPVYGVEKYLDKCVQSIVDQTYKNIEIILVDDGSIIDNCPKMCDEWAKKDSRIIVIHKENGGQGTARNMALDIMSGDYVLFVDSDDYILPNMVQRLVENTNDGANDIVLCQYSVDNGIRIKNVASHSSDALISNLELVRNYVVKRIIFSGPVCKLFRASLFENVRFPGFRAHEDAYIMHRLFGMAKNAMLISDNLYVVVLRNDSTEAKPFNKNKMHLIECEVDLRKFINENYPQFSNLIIHRLPRTTINMIKAILVLKSSEDFEQEEELCKQILMTEREILNETNCDAKLINEIDLYLKNRNSFKKKCKLKSRIKQTKEKIKTILKKIKIKRPN